MPRNDAPTSDHDRSVTRSPSRIDDSSTMTTVASVPISATSATVVSLTAVKPSPMSAAKSTPPAAQARNAAQENRRRVTTIAVNEIATPVHNRSMAKVGPGRSLHLTSTGPHADTNVASHTAAIPRRQSGSRSGIRPSSQRPRTPPGRLARLDVDA